MTQGIVVSGFPGVGKSTLFSNPKGIAILDSDSSNFSWQNQAEKIRHPDWPDNYMAHIRESLPKVDLVCVSSHDVVRDALVKAGVPFALVYPGPEMKDEYIRRYVERGNQEGFIKLLTANYDTWIKELMAQEGCRHIVLQPGQHLSDVVDRIFS